MSGLPGKLLIQDLCRFIKKLMHLKHMTLYITVGKGNFLFKQALSVEVNVLSCNLGALHIKHIGCYMALKKQRPALESHTPRP